MSNHEQLAKKIVKLVGGDKNIEGVIHCVTRLRFTLKDQSKADDDLIKKSDGVVGLAKNSNQYQVIIGTEVEYVYDEICKLLNYKKKQIIEKSRITPKTLIVNSLNFISEVLTPIIPALAASGMLKVILLVCTQLQVLSPDSATYVLLNTMSDTSFYFLPVLTAYLAADKLHVNKVLAMIISGVLIHPDFLALAELNNPVDFIGIPVTTGNYSNSIVPAMLMVIFMSYVEKFAEKASPKIIKTFFKPLLILLITAPVTFLFLAPLGGWIGKGVGSLSLLLFNNFGWLTVGFLGAILPFTVITGLNRALTPVSMQIFTELGHEPLFRVAYIGANMCQGAAALAVALRTKNKKIKQIAYSSGITTLLSGITEPSIFGINMKLRRPLIATTIAGALSGLYAGYMGVTAYAMAIPGFFSLPMFIGPDRMNIVHALIAYAIAIAGSFVLTLVIGFDDLKDESEDKPKELTEEKIVAIKSPANSVHIEKTDNPDHIFSDHLIGATSLIMPRSDEFYSPLSGKVTMIYPSGHAFSVEEDGVEVLVHIGVDTVNLNGKYFDIKANAGDMVTPEDLIVKIDRTNIIKDGYDLTTFIIVPNIFEYIEEAPLNKEMNHGDIFAIVSNKKGGNHED